MSHEKDEHSDEHSNEKDSGINKALSEIESAQSQPGNEDDDSTEEDSSKTPESEKYNNNDVAIGMGEIFGLVSNLKIQLSSLEKKVEFLQEEVNSLKIYKDEIDEKVRLSRIDQLLIISFYTAVIIGISSFIGTLYNMIQNKTSSEDVLLYSTIGFISIVFLVFLFLFSLHNLFNMNNYVEKECKFYLEPNARGEDKFENIHCKLVKEGSFSCINMGESNNKHYVRTGSKYRTCKRCKNIRVFGVLLSFLIPSIVFIFVLRILNII